MTGQPQVLSVQRRFWLSVQRRFWELIAEGVSTEAAAVAVGVSATCCSTWFRRLGGVNPRISEPQGRKPPRLSHDEREEIMIGTAEGESIRSIARRLGRAPSTIMRDNGRMRAAAPGRHRAMYRFWGPSRRVGRQVRVLGAHRPEAQ